jgi:hypothetical protein
MTTTTTTDEQISRIGARIAELKAELAQGPSQDRVRIERAMGLPAGTSIGQELAALSAQLAALDAGIKGQSAQRAHIERMFSLPAGTLS